MSDEDSIKQLTSAAFWGQLKEVEDLLNQGVDINGRDDRGDTALVWASWRGHADIVQLLIDRGANVKRTCRSGYSPRWYAAAKGHTNIVKMLKEAPGRQKRLKKEKAAAEARIKKHHNDLIEKQQDFLADDQPAASVTSLLGVGGDARHLRQHFERAFWSNKKSEVTWCDVKIALDREDRELLRLLIPRTTMPSEKDLNELNAHQWALLRQCGWGGKKSPGGSKYAP